MPENNNIDKLFQDKLKGLQASPSPKVWSAIEGKITPKKRRLVPLWWFSGVAALFVLGLFLFPFTNQNNDLKSKDNIENTFTTTEKEEILENIEEIFSNEAEKEKTEVVEKSNHNKEIKPQKNKSKIKNQEKTEERTRFGKKFDEKEKGKSKNLTNKKIKQDENETNYQQRETTRISSSSTKNQNKGLPKKIPSKKNVDVKKHELLTTEKKNSENFSEKKTKLWSISTNFAFVNSGSFSNSSPVSENLVNSTQGRNSLAYGISVAVELNKKWSVRSGVQLQQLNYRNDNVIVSSATNDLAAISFNDATDVSVESVSENATSDSFESVNLRTSNATNGDLQQQFGYLEIPIEVKYTINENKKLKTQLVGGFSSLFLTSNNVFINDDFSNRSGEASNLNSINFSTNLGVDFNYQFSKQWSFSVNPMLKTFLNTFSDNANGFSPFNFGVYSGFRYKF